MKEREGNHEKSNYELKFLGSVNFISFYPFLYAKKYSFKAAFLSRTTLFHRADLTVDFVYN